jgi:hypothetical protein
MPSVFSQDKSVMQAYFEMDASEYPGVYLSWDRLTSNDFGLYASPVAGEQVVQRIYSVSKSPQINGNFIEIARLNVPDNEYLDEFGRPGYYYKITLLEVDLSNANETVIATSSPISGDEQLIKTSIAYEIKHLMDIPVYDDELVFNYDRTSARLGYDMMVYNPRPQIRISAKSNDGFEESFKIIDFVNGLSYNDLVVSNTNANYTVTTPSGTQAIDTLFYDLKQDGSIYFMGQYSGNRYPVAIPVYDTVYASYRVKMFSNTEINDALYQALQYINAFPGSPKFPTVASTPYYYEQALVTIATYFLLRRLMNRLTVREIRLLLGDLGDTGGNSYTAGIDLLKENMNNYKDQMEDMRKGAAYAFYPRIATYSTELYQLPGSRSYLFRSMFFKAGAYG